MDGGPVDPPGEVVARGAGGRVGDGHPLTGEVRVAGPDGELSRGVDDALGSTRRRRDLGGLGRARETVG
jgi:hypothetical protein